MYLFNPFSAEEIENIYSDIVIYSVLNYLTLPKIWKDYFADKYDYALKLIAENNLTVPDIDPESLYENLKERYDNYNDVKNVNRKVIDEIAETIIYEFLRFAPKTNNECEKVEYLYDFLSDYLAFSEELVKYCTKIPPIKGLEFDFNDSTPVDHTPNGTLVIGQGSSDEICNLFIMLGKKLHLNIDKEYCNYEGHRHALNKVNFRNGDESFVDLTIKIRNKGTKENSFLVSQIILNKYNNFEFDDNYACKNILTNNTNRSAELIEEISKDKPEIVIIETKTKKLVK